MTFFLRHASNPSYRTLALVFFALISGRASAFGLMVQPSTIELRTDAASQHRQTIQVRNMRPDRALTLTVGASDWTLDEHSKLKLFAPSTQERSAAGWIQFSPATLTLLPGESQQIVVDIAIPASVNVDGDHRVALLISTLLPRDREAGSAVWNRYQVASLIYVAVGDSVSSPLVERSWIERADDGVPVLMTELKNTGNTHARLDGTISVKTGNGETVHQQSYDAVVLDNQTIVKATRLSNLVDIPMAVPLEVTLSLENTVQTSINTGSEAVVINSPPALLRLDPMMDRGISNTYSSESQ